MGKKKDQHTGLGRRRTVLQLDTPRHQSRGLVNYDEDDDDSNDDEYDNDEVSSTKHMEFVHPSNEEDEKLHDFLAEINSLEPPPPPPSGDGIVEQSENVDGVPIEITPDSHCMEEVVLEVPMTAWQHCLDENTEHYYFWNMDTNEVTWEMPEEFTQYLLEYKQYEEILAARQTRKLPTKVKRNGEYIDPPKLADGSSSSETAAFTETDKNAPQKGPLVSYPSIDECTSPEPSYNTNLELRQSTKLSDADSLGEMLISAHAQSTDADIDGVAMDGDFITQSDSAVNVIDTHSGPGRPLKYQENYHNEEKFPVIVEPVIFEGPQLPVFEGPDQSTKKSSEGIGLLLDYEDKESDEEEMPSSTVTDPLEKILHGGKTDVKEELIQTFKGEDNSNDSVQDIDDELENALERKKNELKRILGVEETSDTEKRKLEKEAEEASAIKKQKIESATEENREDAEINPAIAVVELQTTVNDKLEFLDVNRDGLSKLQILLIETQTRVHDWYEGGLNADYLLTKLKEAAKEIEQFEETAAPPGWTCHWDRSYKRYFYMNDVTGESQWEYPKTEEECEDKYEESGDHSEDDENQEKLKINAKESAEALAVHSVQSSPSSSVSSPEPQESTSVPIVDEAVNSCDSNEDQMLINPSVPDQISYSSPPPLPPTHTPVSQPPLPTSSPPPLPPDTCPDEPLPPGFEPPFQLSAPPPPPPPPPPESPPPPPPGEEIDLSVPIAPILPPPLPPASPESVDMEIESEEEAVTSSYATFPLSTSDNFPSSSQSSVNQVSSSAVIAALPVIAKPPSVPVIAKPPQYAPLSAPSYLNAVPKSTGPQLSSTGVYYDSAVQSSVRPVSVERPVLYNAPMVVSSTDSVASTSAVSGSVKQSALQGKEKKKKKVKSTGSSLALKKKQFPAMVQKWQQIQSEVSEQVKQEEEFEDLDPETRMRLRIEKWKQEQTQSVSGNANFEEVPTDWRERKLAMKKQNR